MVDGNKNIIIAILLQIVSPFSIGHIYIKKYIKAIIFSSITIISSYTITLSNTFVSVISFFIFLTTIIWSLTDLIISFRKQKTTIKNNMSKEATKNIKKCELCNKKLRFVEEIFLEGKCYSCHMKEKERIRLETKNIETAKEILEEKGIKNNSFKIRPEIMIFVEGTPLEKHLPIKIISEGYLIINNENSYQELIDKIIKNNFDEKKIKDLINTFYERLIISYETEKIKSRQERIELRQKAEKEYFGKEKTKREAVPEEDKKAILEKFKNKCAICGATEGLHIHHKDKNPKNNVIDNLIVLCSVCHKKVHMKVR